MPEDGISKSTTSLTPGVFSSYGHAWRHLWKKFLDLLLGMIIMAAITVPISIIISLLVTDYWPQQAVNLAFSIFLAGPLGFGFAYMTLRAVRNERVEVQHLFEGFKQYGNVVLTILLMTLIVAVPSYIAQAALIYLSLIGTLLSLAVMLVMIVLIYKLAFTPFLVVDRKLKALDAIKTSWNMTNGNFWNIFLISLLAIPIVFIGLLCLLVGVIPAIIWVYLAIASLYHAVDMGQTASSISLKEPLPGIPPGYSSGTHDSNLYP